MKKILFSITIFMSFLVYSQTNIEKDSLQKVNPIAFYEIYTGYGGLNGNTGWMFGANINYQFFKTDLLTARFNAMSTSSYSYLIITPIYPLLTKKEEQLEIAMLYGKRWVNKGHSFSISSGLSYVHINHFFESNNYSDKQTEKHIGFSYEVNIKWFKKEKRPFRVYYGIIPTGKRKVSFGRAVGIKLIGNFSKNNYTGVAFTYGLGWHKKYE